MVGNKKGELFSYFISLSILALGFIGFISFTDFLKGLAYMIAPTFLLIISVYKYKTHQCVELCSFWKYVVLGCILIFGAEIFWINMIYTKFLNKIYYFIIFTPLWITARITIIFGFYLRVRKIINKIRTENRFMAFVYIASVSVFVFIYILPELISNSFEKTIIYLIYFVLDIILFSFLVMCSFDSSPEEGKIGWLIITLGFLLFLVSDIVYFLMVFRGGQYFIGDVFYYITYALIGSGMHLLKANQNVK